jgi:hypothetical protein
MEEWKMMVRSSHIYKAIQYNKRGDHPDVHVYSSATPIIGELPGEENRWPTTGRLATLDECKPEDLRYQVTIGKRYPYIELGWWLLFEDEKMVGAVSPKNFKKNFESLED